MQNGEIRAVYTQDSIRVYQAYSDFIADDAVKNGRFGAGFKIERMTWIKPSFLWMMYRCGWAEKKAEIKKNISIKNGKAVANIIKTG